MKSLLVVLSIGLLTCQAAAAAPCRDGKGKFVACPPVAAQKCRDSKGKFVKCGAAPSVAAGSGSGH